MERRKTFLVLVVISTSLIILSYKSIPEIYYGNNMKHVTYIVTKREALHQTKVSVSHPNCRKLFQIQGFPKEQFPQDDQNMESFYRRLSEELPPTAVDQGLITPTRLQFTNGSVPYLPCRVQLYNSKKVRHCFVLRGSDDRNGSDLLDEGHHSIKGQGIAKTWLAFVGDSKMRGKFAAMVLSLKSDFSWIVRWDAGNNGQYVKVDLEYMISMKTLNGMRVLSTNGLLQIDFVAATRGVGFWSKKGTLNKFTRNKSVPLLHRWATTSEDIPHLIVIGHGLWSFFQLFVSFLAPYDDILKEWKQTADFLVNVSPRTNILVWKQSRKRDFAALDHLKGKKFKLENILKNYVLSNQAVEWIDFSMHEALKSSGLTVWDSSMPFNLANIRECAAIREVLHSGYNNDYDPVNNNTHISEKRRPQGGMDIQGLVHYDKTSGEREIKENKIDFGGIYQQKGTENEENRGKDILKEESIEKSTQLNMKMGANANINEANKLSERKHRKDNNSPEIIDARYDMLLKTLLDNFLDIKSTHKLSSAKKDSFYKYNGDTPYNNYIDYVLDALKTTPLQDLQSLYDSPGLNCKDANHNSKLTLQDEMHMIFNLLCNQYEPKQDDLCCQI